LRKEKKRAGNSVAVGGGRNATAQNLKKEGEGERRSRPKYASRKKTKNRKKESRNNFIHDETSPTTDKM